MTETFDYNWQNHIENQSNEEVDDCICWNPEIMEESDSTVGYYYEYCEKCGQSYSKACNPRDDVLRTLTSIRDSIGNPKLNDEILRRLLDITIKQIRETN